MSTGWLWSRTPPNRKYIYLCHREKSWRDTSGCRLQEELKFVCWRRKDDNVRKRRGGRERKRKRKTESLMFRWSSPHVFLQISKLPLCFHNVDKKETGAITPWRAVRAAVLHFYVLTCSRALKRCATCRWKLKTYSQLWDQALQHY